MESNSKSECALQSTPERSNFQRLSILLIVGGTETLLKLLDSKLPPETTLQDFIADSKVKSLIIRHLTRPQKELLYPPSGASAVVRRNLDISIIFKLLRNACGMTEPAKGWDQLPDEADVSLEADIARIKFYRNSVYGHNPSMTISCNEFFVLLMAISTALVRIAGHVSTACQSQLQAQIGKLISEPVDKSQVNEALNKWVEEEREERKEFKTMLEKVNDKSQEIHANVEALLNKTINPQQTSSPTSEQESQASGNLQYSPTTIINIKQNNLHISGQPSTNANPVLVPNSPEQLESLSPLGRPANIQQSYTLPLAPGQSNSFFRRTEYTRQFGHDGSALSTTSRAHSSNTVLHSRSAVQLSQTGRSESTLSERDRAQKNESFYPEFARKVEPDIAPQSVVPSPESNMYAEYQDTPPKINEAWKHHGADYSSDTAPRQETLTADGCVRRADGQNWQVGGHDGGASDEGATSEQPQRGHLTFSISCKVINHDSLHPNAQGLQFKENRAAQFLAEKYINLSSRESSDFLQYLQKSMQLTVERVHVQGNKCMVEVSSTSQTAVEKLWSEYICGNLREITICTLITEEEEELTLEVEIDGEEYKHCCMSFHTRGQIRRESKKETMRKECIGLESPRQRGTDTKRSKSLSNESQGGEHEIQRHSYRRSKSDLETTKAAQELYEVICKNGGSLSMSTALSKLSSESGQTVAIVNHYSADSFAKRFEDLFVVKDCGYTVETIVPIRFCKVEQEKRCTNKYCPDLHLCPFHIADKCMYKDFCKHSHDVNDVHTTFVFALHGLENLTKKERYKLLQFITSDPVKRMEWMAPTGKLPKICKHYNSSPTGCRPKDGEHCSFLHVCRHWVLGDCCYGKRLCKRAHEFSASREARILERHNIGRMLEEELLKILRESLTDKSVE